MIQIVSKWNAGRAWHSKRTGNSGRSLLSFALAAALGCLLPLGGPAEFAVQSAHGQVAGAAAGGPPLDARSRTIVQSVEMQVKRAGAAYAKGDYPASGASLRKAIDQLKVAEKVSSAEMHDALMPLMKRIVNARAMLELEGITLPPFRIPERPAASSAKPAEEMPPGDDSGGDGNQGVSFVSDVSPILVDKCGGCHIRGSKGGFSTESFAKLMQGPPEGVVVFAGDVVASRLIETIETGDMPRGGGKVSPAQLNTLKQWILEGAKFDGPDPTAMLTSLRGNSGDAPATPEPPKETMVGAPTGDETVSFARDVAPLLVKNCTGCHLDAMQTRGGLRMDTLAQLLRGGDSGQALSPGNGESSLIVQKLRGTAGDRMPAGGRPPLADNEIQLISTWISEGAKVDQALVQTPMKVVTAQAWLAAAASSEVSERRADLAEEDFRLAGADVSRLQKHSSDHFAVWGEVSPATLESVAQSAEKALAAARKFLPAASGAPEDYFHGKASIYVLPKRYNYSEFSKMVEGRSVPSDWSSHWKYDGIRSYVAVVASERDDEEQIAERVAAPVASLAVVSRGEGVPRWFAEGLGTTISGGESKRDRNENMRRQAELITAVGSLKSGKDFLNGKLPPERSDRMAVALAESFLSRQNRRGFDAVMRSLQSGQPFPAAFQSGMKTTPLAYVDAWLQWVK